jgi:Cation transporter/ATPase, N-terminus
MSGMNQHLPTFWGVSNPDLLQRLQTAPKGLTSQEAQQRLSRYGANLHDLMDALIILGIVFVLKESIQFISAC